MNMLVSAIGFLLIVNAGNGIQQTIGTVLAAAGVNDVLREYKEN